MSLLPDVVLEMNDVYTRLQACKCISALINRMPSGENNTNNTSSQGIKDFSTMPSGKNSTNTNNNNGHDI